MQDSPGAAPLNRGEEFPRAEETPVPGEKKRRIGRSSLLALKISVLVLIFVAGTFGGLYAGGGMALLLDRVIPMVEKIPKAGSGLSLLLQRIPRPASSSQIRQLELQEREAFLDAKEKAVEEKQRDLEKQEKIPEKQFLKAEPVETAQQGPLPGSNGAESSDAGILESTLSEMAPSKAARILALMDVSEVGPVFERMDPDWRAQVLGKMPPKEAARFLRYLKGNRPSSSDSEAAGSQ